MKSDRRTAVAIVGAGFSGTMVAARLARRGIESILVEPRDVAGRGTAFSTSDPAHLLNVPAGNMSAWPERPDDFSSRGGSGDAFVQRRHFGTYLREILDDALASGATLVRDRAVAASQDDGVWTIALESGDSIRSSALVLAIGNQPPGMMKAASGAGERFIADPWGSRARQAVEDCAGKSLDVAILGTGLTMVDVVLSLESAGHKGRIVAISRRGLAPRSHAPADPAPIDWNALPEPRVRPLLSWLRRRSSEVGWRSAVDSLRPHSRDLWQALGLEEQRRFLRHARPWWDVHRHRIAPEVAAKLDSLVAEGRLDIVAGRLESVTSDGDGLAIAFRRRSTGDRETLDAAYMFNCTGPLHSLERTRDPLLRQMLDDGLAAPDSLGIGLALDGRSRVVGADRAWALGALTKGLYWEIIAVPDIRHQAADVAEDIATELCR